MSTEIDRYLLSNQKYLIPISFSEEAIKEVKQKGGKWVKMKKRWLVANKEDALYLYTKYNRQVSLD